VGVITWYIGMSQDPESFLLLRDKSLRNTSMQRMIVGNRIVYFLIINIHTCDFYEYTIKIKIDWYVFQFYERTLVGEGTRSLRNISLVIFFLYA